MTATTPIVSDPFRDNPYRVLGLPGEAAWPEIARASERIRGLASWGAYRTAWDLPWLLHPVRREPGHVDAALARLTDADLRLRDRLFWFHERDAESAVAYLTPASIRDAMEGWAATSLPLARHDAAVVGLLASLALDPRIEDPSLWRRMLAEWRSAVERDEYWLAILQIEAEGGFDPPATLEAMSDLRETALQSVASVLITRARTAWATGDPGAPNRALAVLRDELPSELVDYLREELSRTTERVVADDVLTAAIDDPEAREIRRLEVSKHLSRLRVAEPASPASVEIEETAAALAEMAREPQAPATPAEADPEPPAPVVDPGAAPEPVPAVISDAAPEPSLAAPTVSEPVGPPDETAAVWTDRSRQRVRRVFLAGLAAAVVAAFFLLPWSRPGQGRAPDITDRQLLAFAARLDARDDAIARNLIERAENGQEKAFIERRAHEYGELVEDYEWRIANGFTYDRAGYDRVRQALREALERQRLATERQTVLAQQYHLLVRGRMRDVVEYNDRVR